MTVNIDVNLLKKYWLSASATVAFIWTSLNPAAQQQIIHYISTAVHGHPTLTFLAGLVTLVVADLKQSPITVKPDVPVVPAPPAK